ncbi:MAG: TIGR04086 family membrane protein [Clostridia bacterium]|nr:TIGR04086 family membrane protein [Clostridia bacterium]
MKKGKHNAAKDTSSEFSLINLFRAALVGLAVFAISSVVLMIVSTLIAYNTADPSALTLPLSVATLLSGMFAGGFAAAKSAGENKLIAGLFFTAFAFLLLLLLKITLSGGNGASLKNSGIYMALSIVAAMSGTLFTSALKGKKGQMKKRSGNFKKKK